MATAFCHLSAAYKMKQRKFYPQGFHARGRNTEEEATWPLWLP